MQTDPTRSRLLPFLCVPLLLLIQTATAQPPVVNPALAASTWPIYHANTHATAASVLTGPGAVSAAQTLPALTDRRIRNGSVSPWTVMAAPYWDGSQAVITTPTEGVAKYLLRDGLFEAVDFLALERNTLDFDWGIALLASGLGVVTERKFNRFVLFGDAEPGPLSMLEVKARIPIDKEIHGGLTAHHTLAHDGTLIALTFANRLIAVDLEQRAVVASFDLPTQGGTSFHNSFPIDEQGRIFLSTQTLLAAVDWNGQSFALAWTAPYDMRGPGCENIDAERSRRREILAVARGAECTGSGTTPTLIGDVNQGVVVIVDGHAPQNNLVAFWRDEIPSDWIPLANPDAPGQRFDARVAGRFALPHSTPVGDGFTAENSPAALGNGIVVAQWAGLRPGRNPPRGVQRVDWNPHARHLELAWAMPDVHFNGVPTIACQQGQQCQVYGMGRYGANYRYRSLDFLTGQVTGEIDLGRDSAVLDQGNNHAVAQDGSIVYSGKSLMVNIR